MTLRSKAIRSPLRKQRSRRGVSLVLVLGLVAIALAVSYALLRTQTTSTQMQRNVSRRVDARQAALAGLSATIRKMHAADWAGVDVGSSRVDLQACKLEYSIVSPK